MHLEPKPLAAGLDRTRPDLIDQIMMTGWGSCIAVVVVTNSHWLRSHQPSAMNPDLLAAASRFFPNSSSTGRA